MCVLLLYPLVLLQVKRRLTRAAESITPTLTRKIARLIEAPTRRHREVLGRCTEEPDEGNPFNQRFTVTQDEVKMVTPLIKAFRRSVVSGEEWELSGEYEFETYVWEQVETRPQDYPVPGPLRPFRAIEAPKRRYSSRYGCISTLKDPRELICPCSAHTVMPQIYPTPDEGAIFEHSDRHPQNDYLHMDEYWEGTRPIMRWLPRIPMDSEDHRDRYLSIVWDSYHASPYNNRRRCLLLGNDIP